MEAEGEGPLRRTVLGISGEYHSLGNSSWKWLQNCFTNSNYQEQGITVALALTELFIAEKQRGACRVHGGGFAGVIMAMLPNELVDEYICYIERAMGEGSAYRMSIRLTGLSA